MLNGIREARDAPNEFLHNHHLATAEILYGSIERGQSFLMPLSEMEVKVWEHLLLAEFFKKE